MYHYQESGLRNVWLENGYDLRETPYGHGIAIHDAEGLHRALARGLIAKGGKLTGAELRFLRQEMGLSQAKLATMLGNEAQTVALWEKRGGQPNIADRFIRAIYREQQEGNAHIREMIERLVDADLEDGEVRITMQQGDGGGGWRLDRVEVLNMRVAQDGHPVTAAIARVSPNRRSRDRPRLTPKCLVKRSWLCSGINCAQGGVRDPFSTCPWRRAAWRSRRQIRATHSHRTSAPGREPLATR